ncbi:hypothetical protein LBMAG27_08860 [Bacteroidota bacterium]|nr:hypothetical protein LBMAG27_08860 [Bacteroidota bacterium]
MKKISFLFFVLISISSFTYGQQIITGVKNFNILKKGSSSIPQTRFKTGEMVMMKNSDEGMNFDIIKNGKTTPLIDPCTDCIFGQTAELDIDGDGKTEVLIGTRLTPETFEVKIYNKAEFEVDYKLFTTINGQDHCEFIGDNTVKIFTTDLKIAHLKFKSDGSWVVLEQ